MWRGMLGQSHLYFAALQGLAPSGNFFQLFGFQIAVAEHGEQSILVLRVGSMRR